MKLLVNYYLFLILQLANIILFHITTKHFHKKCKKLSLYTLFYTKIKQKAPYAKLYV